MKFASPFPTAGDCSPQPRVLFGCGPARLEEAGIGADGLGWQIACGFDKLRIDVLNHPGAIRDHDDVRALLDRTGKEPQRPLHLAPFLDFRRQLLLLLDKIPNQLSQLPEFSVLPCQRGQQGGIAGAQAANQAVQRPVHTVQQCGRQANQ